MASPVKAAVRQVKVRSQAICCWCGLPAVVGKTKRGELMVSNYERCQHVIGKPEKLANGDLVVNFAEGESHA